MASIQKRPNGKWRARFRDDEGQEHARHFERKVDASQWLDTVTASLVRGDYVSPGAGVVTFREYAERWRAVQPHRPTTAELVERHLRVHVYPAWGTRPLRTIRTTDVQALIKTLHADLAPATVVVVHRYVTAILKAAVADRELAVSPAAGVKAPKIPRRQIVPMTVDEVEAIREAMPGHLRALVILAAGTGLRQGEAFGLTLGRVDFLRRRLTVDRQLVGLSGREPTLQAPKTDASVRVVPLPQVVVDALARHVQDFPPSEDGFLFTNLNGDPLRRSAFGTAWRQACAAAGVRGHTFHSLRHFYASLLIRHGESVRTVQDRLGHASATETLETYAHLWPDSDDRTRAAVDGVLGEAPADCLRTETEEAG